MKKYIMLSLLIAAGLLANASHAADCDPNGLGGYSCVNDDGSTSDSMPNETGGTDTLSSNGDLTSSEPNDDNAELDGSSLSPYDDSANANDALKGRDWNSPSNINDGAATSSMDMTNQP